MAVKDTGLDNANTKDSDVFEVDNSVVELQGKKELSPSDEQLFVNLRYQRFRKSMYSIQELHQRWEDIDTLDRGEQWKDASIPPWVPKPVTNYLRYVRTTKRANLAAQFPSPTLIAEHPEDQGITKMFQTGLNHVWQHQHIDRMGRKAIDRALKYGTSIAVVYNDDTYIGGRYYKENDPKNQLYRGMINAKLFPITNFFPDPDAYCLEDCKYIETTELMPLESVKKNPLFRKYAGDKLDRLISIELDMEDDASGTFLERDRNPVDTSYGHILGDEMATVHTHYERYMDEKGMWHLDVSYYLRNHQWLLYRIVDAKPNEYPFAILYDEEEDEDFFGKSTLMDLVDNQNIINKLDQTVSIIGVLHQNPQKVVARESGINGKELSRTGTLPGKVWMSNTNPADSIYYLNPPPIPPGLEDLKNAKVQDIKDIAGINEAYSGQSVGSLTTSTGVNSLIERATMRDKDKLVQIDAFAERLAYLILRFMMDHWTEPRMLTNQMSNGRVEHLQFVPPKETGIKIENLSWRIHSDIYAKAPTTQDTMRQAAQQLIQWQGQYNYSPALITPEELITMMQFPHVDQILNRMAADRQNMAQNQAQQPDLAGLLASGKIKVSLQSNDPNLIQKTLDDSAQFAQQQQQQQQQQDLVHLQQGIATTPGAQMPQQQQQPEQPTGPAGIGPAAMTNMTRG